MKKILLFIFCCQFFWSCMDDLGTYDYNEINEISIDTLGSHEIELFDTLCLTMNVHQTIPTSDMEYIWYYYPDTKDNKVDTLGTGKELKIKVDIAPGDYIIYAQAKDMKSGRWGKQTATLKVVTQYSSGMMLYGLTDGSLSLDMVNSVGKIYEIYSGVSGERLGESPSFIGMGQQEIFLFCNDARGGVSLSSGSLIKENFVSEMFWQRPEVISPQAIGKSERPGVGTYGDYLINDGKMYFRKKNEILFSPSISNDTKFSKYVLPYMDMILVFDENTTSFYYFNLMTDYSLTDIEVLDNSVFNPRNMGMKPIFMACGRKYGADDLTPSLCGIFEDESGTLYRVIAKMVYRWSGLAMSSFVCEPIPEGNIPGFRESPCHEIYNWDASAILYAKNNLLYMYDIAAGTPAEPIYDVNTIKQDGESAVRKINNIYSQKIFSGSGFLTSDPSTLYVTTSVEDEDGKNGSLHVFKFKEDGNGKIEKLEQTYWNVCGETVSIIYKQ